MPDFFEVENRHLCCLDNSCINPQSSEQILHIHIVAGVMFANRQSLHRCLLCHRGGGWLRYYLPASDDLRWYRMGYQWHPGGGNVSRCCLFVIGPEIEFQFLFHYFARTGQSVFLSTAAWLPWCGCPVEPTRAEVSAPRLSPPSSSSSV